MWEQLNRVIKPNGAIVLFGAEPFSSLLIASNIKSFKYQFIWEKSRKLGFMNAKLKPLNIVESISVFSNGKTSNGNKNNMPYFPQGLVECNITLSGKKKQTHGETNYARKNQPKKYKQSYTNYPTNLLKFKNEPNPIHPTQKPVALLEYLIKTYTLENEIVLDFTMGSGSTGVACVTTNRQFIGIEKDKKYFKIAEKRIKGSIE